MFELNKAKEEALPHLYSKPPGFRQISYAGSQGSMGWIKVSCSSLILSSFCMTFGMAIPQGTSLGTYN